MNSGERRRILRFFGVFAGKISRNLKRRFNQQFFQYRSAGVREYWIVNPMKGSVIVYQFDGEERAALYSFDEPIQSGIYPKLFIQISELLS